MSMEKQYSGLNRVWFFRGLGKISIEEDMNSTMTERLPPLPNTLLNILNSYVDILDASTQPHPHNLIVYSYHYLG